MHITPPGVLLHRSESLLLWQLKFAFFEAIRVISLSPLVSRDLARLVASLLALSQEEEAPQ